MPVTKETLLGLKLRQVDVPAPEIGPDAVVTVLEPDGAAWERLSAADYPVGEDGQVHYQSQGHLARWAIACVVDDVGVRMFTDADTDAVARLPASLLKRIVRAAQELAGSAIPAAVEAEAKNSSGGPSSSSPTA